MNKIFDLSCSEGTDVVKPRADTYTVSDKPVRLEGSGYSRLTAYDCGFACRQIREFVLQKMFSAKTWN